LGKDYLYLLVKGEEKNQQNLIKAKKAGKPGKAKGK